MGQQFARQCLWLSRHFAEFEIIESFAYAFKEQLEISYHPNEESPSEEAVEFINAKRPGLASAYNEDDWDDFWEGALDEAKGHLHKDIDSRFE
jgi:hypothetical protein